VVAHLELDHADGDAQHVGAICGMIVSTSGANILGAGFDDRGSVGAQSLLWRARETGRSP